MIIAQLISVFTSIGFILVSSLFYYVPCCFGALIDEYISFRIRKTHTKFQWRCVIICPIVPAIILLCFHDLIFIGEYDSNDIPFGVAFILGFVADEIKISLGSILSVIKSFGSIRKIFQNTESLTKIIDAFTHEEASKKHDTKE